MYFLHNTIFVTKGYQNINIMCFQTKVHEKWIVITFVLYKASSVFCALHG